MSTLDSRSLTYIDTFGRRLDRPGPIRYRIVSPSVACQPSHDDLPFVIDVADGKGDKQHDVTVRFKEGKLVAEPTHVKATAGDVVLWHSVRSTPAYAVQGECDGSSFDSSSLTGGAVYTHAFGLPGEYEWVDAHRRSVSGLIRVEMLDSGTKPQCREWMEALARPSLVVIGGESVDPYELSILAGQTVFFAVSEAEGITITDSRLLASEAA